MKTIIKKAALAAAIISAPLAASAANLVGGGASLPALAYVGTNFTGTDPQSRLSTTFSDTLLTAGDDSLGDPYKQAEHTQGSIFQVFQSNNSGDNDIYSIRAWVGSQINPLQRREPD